MKIFQGRIILLKNKKTAVVEVERFISDPVYKKRFKKNKKYQVHCETEQKIGTVVKFVETKPISKLKKWKILESKR